MHEWMRERVFVGSAGHIRAAECKPSRPRNVQKWMQNKKSSFRKLKIVWNCLIRVSGGLFLICQNNRLVE